MDERTKVPDRRGDRRRSSSTCQHMVRSRLGDPLSPTERCGGDVYLKVGDGKPVGVCQACGGVDRREARTRRSRTGLQVVRDPSPAIEELHRIVVELDQCKAGVEDMRHLNRQLGELRVHVGTPEAMERLAPLAVSVRELDYKIEEIRHQLEEVRVIARGPRESFPIGKPASSRRRRSK